MMSIGPKRALVCSHCDVIKGCAFDFRDSGARVCSLPSVASSAVIREDVKPNSVSKLVVTGNVLPCGGDKCALPFLREGNGFDD